MDSYKEFFGKTLDDAIDEACSYYGVPREKLEIELVNDAKSGIFGLVGARKACIRAARLQLDGSVFSDMPKEERNEVAKVPPKKNSKQEHASKKQRVAAPKNTKRKETTTSQPEPIAVPKEAVVQAEPVTQTPMVETPEVDDAREEDLPVLALDICSPEEVCNAVCQVIGRLIAPIVGDVPCSAEVIGERVRVIISCDDSAGILVGREGQTLAAVKYLSARIVAKQLGGALRLQVDVGNYRERQDERLRELALSLAEKVKTNRRPQTTRPLSAYQRRIIHLTLEEDPVLVTHSKGEGSQRRVVIQLRRSPKAPKNATESAESVADFVVE